MSKDKILVIGANGQIGSVLKLPQKSKNISPILKLLINPILEAILLNLGPKV